MDQNLDSHKKHQSNLKKEKDKMAIQLRKLVKDKTKVLNREKADMFAKYKKESSDVLKLTKQLSTATEKATCLEDEVSALKQEKSRLNRKLKSTTKQLESMGQLKNLCKDLERFRDSRSKRKEEAKRDAKQATLNSKKYEEELDKAMILLKNFEPTLDKKKQDNPNPNRHN